MTTARPSAAMGELATPIAAVYTELVRSVIFRKLLAAAVLLVGVSLVTSDFLLTRYITDRERDAAGEEMSRLARLLGAELDRNPADLEAWAHDGDQRSGYRVTV